MTLLEITSISKAFAATPVLRDVSFHADEGEIVCLLGPSGCGKTTLLRIIAGLETADAGQVHFDGQPLDGVAVHRRGLGLMFQDFALFPHKDVAANVAFGLRMQGLSGAQVDARVAEMLTLVGLAGYEQRRVYDLSGGEQQRVALARSLAPGPRLLMLDEPLGSLDRALREELMNELRAILKRVGVTAIYVTHDQQEAFALADRVLLMNRGHIVQQGTPQEVYRRPASAWVARFLGLSNLLAGWVAALDPLQVDTPLGRLSLPQAGEPVAIGQEVTLLIRPEAAQLAGACPGETGILVEAEVVSCSFRGSHYRLVVRHEAGLDLSFELVAEAGRLPQPGEAISLTLRPEAFTPLGEITDEQDTD
jgi:ABC-type Fe3+/spermidine/putrescine transport system ATPase subunit